MDSRKYLNDEERAALEASLRPRLEGPEYRDACLILMALHSGGRASEILALGWKDLNLQTGEVYINTLKGGRPRAVVIPNFLLGALRRLKADSPERPFPISYNRFAEIWRLYRTVDKPLHSLRHTFAMRAYAKTRDIRFVQRALGHRSITNTMVYADCEYTASQFRKMMRVR